MGLGRGQNITSIALLTAYRLPLTAYFLLLLGLPIELVDD